MFSALLDTLGKATRRIFGAEGSAQGEPVTSPAQGEEPPTPQPVRNLAFDQLEADLARDEQELSTPQGRAARVREDGGSAPVNRPTPLQATGEASAEGSRAYEDSFNLHERAPSAHTLFNEARKASEAAPPTPKAPLSFRASGQKARQHDASTITPQRSLSLIMDEPERVEERAALTKEPPSPAPAQPDQVIQHQPSATRVTSSSRVLRPDPPPEDVSAELSPPPRRRRARAEAQAKAPAAERHPRSRSNQAGDSYMIGARPTREQRKLNPRLAQGDQVAQRGFQASGSFGLKDMSASQARLTPEQRLAPALKERPEKVESSAYARYWGSYSAASPSVQFSSILDYDVKPGWRKAWTQQVSDAAAGGLIEGERAGQTNDSILELLGGRTGYFGDLMDRQWASKLHPKKDAAEFAYQESSKFR